MIEVKKQSLSETFSVGGAGGEAVGGGESKV